MKAKTKLIALLLCIALLAVTASGCASFAKLKDKLAPNDNSVYTEPENTDDDSVPEYDVDIDNIDDVDDSEDDKSSSSSSGSDITIEEQVVFDKNGITITALEYEASDYGDQISLLIENSSDIDVTLSSKIIMVNGLQICNAILYADVAAGEKAYDPLFLMLNEYEKECIGAPGEIALYLSAMDDEFNNVFIDEYFQIRTSAYTGKDAEMNLPVKELVNSNGVKISFIGVAENKSLQSKDICFYIENNTNGNITVSSDEVAINGIVMDLASLATAYHEGEKGIASFSVFNMDLENSKIDSIDTIEFKLDAYEIDTMDPVWIYFNKTNVLASTGTITINANK